MESLHNKECNKKKVYADYHGLKYTRDIDGKLGQWKLHGFAAGSKVKDTYVNWNADLIDKSGRHQTSALSYPLVGMQSQMDSDYIEYQILLAKSANIDGFIVEWGFPEHYSNIELKEILKVAEKYNFEIGINWCDAWHFYQWIEEFHPEIKERQDKVDLFKKSLQYLLDNVFSKSTGVLSNGHPIIFLFGGGLSPEEFKDVKMHSYNIPKGLKEPWFFGRAPIEGKEEKEKVSYYFNYNTWYNHEEKNAKALLDGTFGWIPTRVRRKADKKYELWDRYATKEDTVDYLKVLIKTFEDNSQEFKLRISVVSPEMDNRGCASWGKHDLSYIPRENGATYSSMWDFNIKNRESIDVVFIASWNDFTERHQIEPTVEDGDREIRATEKYSAEFKGIKSETLGITLPFKLFNLRKKAKFFSNTGIEVTELSTVLNKLAFAISDAEYYKAEELLKRAYNISNILEKKVEIKTIALNAPSNQIKVRPSLENHNMEYDMEQGIFITFSEEVSELFRNYNFCGYLNFEYLDIGESSFTVITDTQRKNQEKEDFSVVCDIKKSNSGQWSKARVEIFKSNSAFMHKLKKEFDFIFKGEGKVRNISFDFNVFVPISDKSKENKE